MIPLPAFAAALKRMGSAFGKQATDGLIAEYYRVFESMSEEHFSAVADWAIRTLDTPFPSIARLRKEAIERGWLSESVVQLNHQSLPKRREADFDEFVCPDCEGTFLIRRDDLVAAASQGQVFQCINARHWVCTRTIAAAEMLRK